MILFLQVTYILEAHMARPVPPRDEQWLLYVCFVMHCLLILTLIRSFVINCLNRVGFMHTGVGGTFKWCYYRNHFGHAYFGLRNGNFNIGTSISNIQLNTNKDTTCKVRNDDGEGLHRTDESIYQQSIANVLQENAAMRHLVVCTICNTRDRRVVFLPCRHLLTCEVCGQATDTCPACRLEVNSRVVLNQ